MHAVAVYSLKGGVGKTSLAVNLAWLAAVRGGQRTLLWDLDAQGASTFILREGRGRGAPARDIFTGSGDPAALAERTGIPRLDLLAADASLRDLDAVLAKPGRDERIAGLLTALGTRYDRILLDCPPGLTATSEQVLRAADLIVIPAIPSPLSRRALDAVVAHLDAGGRGARGTVMPVFNMVDRRRTTHLAALAAEPRWPVVPASSAVELMAVNSEPLFGYAPASPAAAALDALWAIVERRFRRTGAASPAALAAS